MAYKYYKGILFHYSRILIENNFLGDKKMRILLYDSKVMIDKEKIIDGYLFIEDNKIEEIGEGPPPEDLKDSELVYSLKDKLIMPSFSLTKCMVQGNSPNVAFFFCQ